MPSRQLPILAGQRCTALDTSLRLDLNDMVHLSVGHHSAYLHRGALSGCDDSGHDDVRDVYFTRSSTAAIRSSSSAIRTA